MARFVFTLQIVLEQREREERLCQLELAQAQQSLVQLELQLQQMNAEMTSSNADLKRLHEAGKLDVPTIAQQRRYLAAMKLKVIDHARQMADARLAVEAKQRKLAEAAKQRKAIEVLRDKQKQRWSAEQDKRERDLMDEAGMQIAFNNLTLSANQAGMQS
jgi:flagellar protein FliJ